MSTVAIEGVDRLLARLGEIEHKGVRKVMLKALVEGAKPLRSAIRGAAPKGETGNLRGGVRYKASRKSTAQRSLAYMVGPFGRGTAHRHLVVGGHEIVGHAPSLTRTGKRTRPDPFVERGRAAAESQAFAAVASAAASRFDELARP